MATDQLLCLFWRSYSQSRNPEDTVHTGRGMSPGYRGRSRWKWWVDDLSLLQSVPMPLSLSLGLSTPTFQGVFTVETLIPPPDSSFALPSLLDFLTSLQSHQTFQNSCNVSLLPDFKASFSLMCWAALSNLLNFFLFFFTVSFPLLKYFGKI